MTPITAILLVITMAMLFAVAFTVYLSIRKQDDSERQRLIAQNKVLRYEHAEFADIEVKLRSKVDWYKEIFSNTEDMVLVHGVNDKLVPTAFIEVNNTACELLQYKRDELLGMTPMHIGYDESTASVLGLSTSDMIMMSGSAVEDQKRKMSLRPVQNLMKRIMEDKDIIYERTYVSKDKKEFPVEVRARCIDLDGRNYVICTAHDITSRKEAQEALRESELRFRSFFEHSPIGVAMYDDSKELVNVNVAFLRMLGVPDREQFKRVDIFNLEFIPAHVREKVRTGESIRLNIEIDFDVVRETSMFITTRTGKGYMDIMINNMGRGRNKKSRGYLVQLQDNTQTHNGEIALRSSERQLRQAEKMEAIGSMAGGIAHDFNNILTPILGYTELALRMCAEDKNLSKFMEEIMKAGHRAKDLVNQILTFSRQKEKDGQPIRVLPIVKEVLTLMRATVPESIEIKRVIKSEHDIVVADPTQIHQVLMNLCTNAWHAMKEQIEGVLEVRVMEFVHEKGSKSRIADLETGRYLQISVCDTGVGMTEEIQKRIFDPFFTTKKTGEGTGMGLSVVKNIITAFKGKIVVDSKVGIGSEFHVVLPILDEEASDQVDMASQPLRTGNETVLLVDDDSTILEMVQRMLDTLGYKSVLAKTGSEALAKFKENPKGIDVIITDQVMPEMQGSELAAAISAIDPQMPIVLCTGFSESFSAETAKVAGITNFLRKPIIMRDLSDVIRNALEFKPA